VRLITEKTRCEGDSSWLLQNILRCFCSPKFYCLIYKSPPLGLCLKPTETSPHTHTHFFASILILSFRMALRVKGYLCLLLFKQITVFQCVFLRHGCLLCFVCMSKSLNCTVCEEWYCRIHLYVRKFSFFPRMRSRGSFQAFYFPSLDFCDLTQSDRVSLSLCWQLLKQSCCLGSLTGVARVSA
jgi:hypothetical protein